MSFIPVLTSDAGSCLTADNWREAQVRTVSCSLESLLHKPGLGILKKLTDLSHYLGWSGQIILNAMTLVSNKEGIYVLRSPYDGSQIKLNSVDLIKLIHQLKPYAVLLPKHIMQDYPNIWNAWTDSILPFISVEDLEQNHFLGSYGVYFSYDFELLDQYIHIPRYLLGNIDLELIQSLTDKNSQLSNGLQHQITVQNPLTRSPVFTGTPSPSIWGEGRVFIETDVPAKKGMQGRVYSRQGEVDLTHEAVQMQFEPIDSECACPTCSQKLTRAYLHHLLKNTPLLCQRFLIQHNVFYAQGL